MHIINDGARINVGKTPTGFVADEVLIDHADAKHLADLLCSGDSRALRAHILQLEARFPANRKPILTGTT